MRLRADAARADTTGREKAIAILTVLPGQVPDQAKAGITKAIAALSQDRADETQLEGQRAGQQQGLRAQQAPLAAAINTSVDGQQKASDTLAALIASADIPYEAKQGLQTAYDAVTAEHGSVADILSRLSDRMPAFVPTFVEGIITQARTDAQGMHENHPTGPPAGTLGGPPSGGIPAGPLAGQQPGPPRSCRAPHPARVRGE